MQKGFAGHVRPAGDGRRDFALGAVAPPIAADEDTADQALLDPRFVLGQFAVRGETGELRARARAAGRPVIGLARAQHEVPAVNAGQFAGRKELHVIDQRVSVGIHRRTDAPRELGQRLDVLKIEFEELILADAPIEISGFALDEIDQIVLGNEASAIEAGRCTLR